MLNARAQNARLLLHNYFRKFLRLRRRQGKNDAVSFQVNLPGRQFNPVLADAHEAANIGIHPANVVVSGTLKGRDLP